MKTIRDIDVKNKRVLIRCDFNVPLAPLDSKHLTGLDKRGNILNDFRIRQVIPTINYLIKNGAKVILMSHLDDPDGPDEKYSLRPVSKKLRELLNQTVGVIHELPLKIEKIKPGKIILLENLRFHKGEKANDENFAKSLASLADIYINDAFGVCHREHASVVGVPKYLPSAAGFLLAKEIKVLSDVLENPQRPLVAIIGGVKIETKIKVISAFLKKADQVLVGGKIAKKVDLKSPKLLLPIDNNEGFDIGPKTINIFSEIIKKARTIIWNGPLGKFEKKEFEKGTKKIALAIAKNEKAFKIAGGGETVEAIKKFGLMEKFDHISTGGGAMLAFLSGEKLPGIEALK